MLLHPPCKRLYLASRPFTSALAANLVTPPHHPTPTPPPAIATIRIWTRRCRCTEVPAGTQAPPCSAPLLCDHSLGDRVPRGHRLPALCAILSFSVLLSAPAAAASSLQYTSAHHAGNSAARRKKEKKKRPPAGLPLAVPPSFSSLLPPSPRGLPAAPLRRPRICLLILRALPPSSPRLASPRAPALLSSARAAAAVAVVVLALRYYNPLCAIALPHRPARKATHPVTAQAQRAQRRAPTDTRPHGALRWRALFDDPRADATARRKSVEKQEQKRHYTRPSRSPTRRLYLYIYLPARCTLL